MLSNTQMAGLPEREDKVSLELTEEIPQSMEVGLAFRDYKGRISSLDFHQASSYVVTASDDDSIRLYDVSTATCLKTINSKKYGVDFVCFTSHPATVIYSSKNGWDESLRFLSLNDNKYLQYFRGHHDRVVPLSLCSRKECFISGSLDRTVLLRDQRAKKCRVFCVYKEDLRQLMMSRGWFLQLPLVDTYECLMPACMKRVPSISFLFGEICPMQML